MLNHNTVEAVGKVFLQHAFLAVVVLLLLDWITKKAKKYFALLRQQISSIYQ